VLFSVRNAYGLGGGGGGHLVYPLKRLQKLDHKNAIEHKKKFSQPQVPPSKEFENIFVS